MYTFAQEREKEKEKVPGLVLLSTSLLQLYEHHENAMFETHRPGAKCSTNQRISRIISPFSWNKASSGLFILTR